MQRRLRTQSHPIHFVFVFLLIALFALSSLTLTLIGMRVYRGVTENAAQNSDSQMILSYIASKLHSYDTLGGVSIAQRDGVSTLELHETLDGEAYVNSLYSYRGTVWERFAPATDPFQPEDGQPLANARSLVFTELVPGLIHTCLVMPNGETRTTSTALRVRGAREAN